MVFDTSFFDSKRTWDDILPYSLFVDDGIILHKNGCLHCCFQYTGKDIDSIEPVILDTIHNQINSIIMRLPERYNIYIDILRERIEYYPSPTIFNNACSLVFETERKFYFTKYNYFFDNIYFFNIIFSPSLLSDVVYNKLISNSDFDKVLSDFKNTVNDIFLQFSSFFPCNMLNSKDFLNYIYYASTYNFKVFDFNFDIHNMFFINTIFDRNVIYDKHNKVLKVGDKYVKYLNLTYLPNATYDGMFNKLLSLNIDFRFNIRFLLLDNESIAKVMNRYTSYYLGKAKTFFQTVMEMATKEEAKHVNTGNMALANDANEALAEATTNASRFGYISISIAVYDDNLDFLEEKLNLIKKNSNDFIFKDDSFHYMSMYIAHFPGAINGNLRKYLVSTNNFVDIMPLFTPYRGNMYNTITGEPYPLMVTSTPANSVYFLNTNVGDTGHTLVIGPSGAGKSFLLLSLTLSFFKYKNSRVIYFDKGRSSRKLCFGMEGSFFDIDDIKNIRLQPLRYLDNENDLIYAQEFIELLLSLQNVTIDATLRLNIADALKVLSTKPVTSRVLSSFCQYVNNKVISDSLSPYIMGGVYGDIFDNHFESGISFSIFTVFEMSGFMELGKNALIPFMYHLFHLLDKLFTKAVPTLLILDEAWLFFDNEYMANKIKAWLKTLRKFKVSIIFATQELADVSNSSISHTIISQTVTKIFLPDESALMPNVYKFYADAGLTDIEIRMLANAVRKRDYYIKNSDGNRMFNLSIGKLGFSLIALDAQDHAFLDTIKNESNKLEHIFKYYGLYDLYKNTIALYNNELTIKDNNINI